MSNSCIKNIKFRDTVIIKDIPLIVADVSFSIKTQILTLVSNDTRYVVSPITSIDSYRHYYSVNFDIDFARKFKYFGIIVMNRLDIISKIIKNKDV